MALVAQHPQAQEYRCQETHQSFFHPSLSKARGGSFSVLGVSQVFSPFASCLKATPKPHKTTNTSLKLHASILPQCNNKGTQLSGNQTGNVAGCSLPGSFWPRHITTQALCTSKSPWEQRWCSELQNYKCTQQNTHVLEQQFRKKNTTTQQKKPNKKQPQNFP